MNRVVPVWVFLFGSMMFSQIANAQSGHDVDPPAQIAPRETGGVKGVTAPARTFQFAVAELDSDGNIVLLSTQTKNGALPNFQPKPKLKKGQKLKTTTKKRQQAYTVAVPYTEVVNGKEVQRMRSETRTRTIPVTESIVVDENGKEVDKAELEIEPMKEHDQMYSLEVPYTEFVNGIAVQKKRTEFRTRKIKLPAGYQQKEQLVRITRVFKAKDIEGFDIVGQQLDNEEVTRRLSDRQPVILVSDKSSIAPYFEVLLKPDTMFLVAPQTGAIKTDLEVIKKD